MPKLEFQQKFEAIIRILPDAKLNAVMDFANYLIEREEAAEFLKMQTNSKAYQEWLGSENDTYDDLFKDDVA